ncbi:MAG: hypothetical protein M3Q12_03105 [Pseudomonadota bacterium]|uniref:hypothetical protein n=1 Tax=Polaromonas sp. TaxID=1869339 RepID=UPI00182C4C97|nr:hypothetical protein [Polaromonas sp.]MBA3595354.1 hypothetical protein [Polaromonas sp.]MDQ3271144.1 hypothetical protein [Pseudomonadota bacterium]
MDGHYMFAGEFVAVAALLFLPPLLFGIAFLAYVSVTRSTWARGKLGRFASAAATLAFCGVCIGLAAAVFTPAPWIRYLGVQDIKALGFWVSVAPFAFIGFAAVLPFIVYWLVGDTDDEA